MSNARDDEANAKRTVILNQGTSANAPTRILGDRAPGNHPATASKLPPTQILGGPGSDADLTRIDPRNSDATVPYYSPGLTPQDRSDLGRAPPSATTSSARPGHYATRVLMPGDEWNPVAPEAGAPEHAQQAGSAQSLAGIEGIPVVGWLVIVSGPGRGKSVSVYYGNNSIGRDADQKIALNFGDSAISAKEQAYIRYNPKDRTFTLIPNNSKTNFVTLNDEAPMMPTPLQSHDCIGLGVTRLIFVPFCGPQFEWSAAEIR